MNVTILINEDWIPPHILEEERKLQELYDTLDYVCNVTDKLLEDTATKEVAA